MLRAIIFDFDGVIVDTERFHFQALQRVLEEEQIRLSWEEYTQTYLAMDDKNCFRTALARHGRSLTPGMVEELSERKAGHFLTAVPNAVTLFPGVEDIIRQAETKHPLAIASGALREEIELILGNVGLREFFRVVVAAEDVVKGKPDPEAYITALARLNRLIAGKPVKPSECLVIEDSRHGVAAATGAGMRCLAVANSYPPEELAAAHLVVKSLEQLDLAQIENLFH
ncbi:MAG: HAD family phosphatase [candidate division NC10 bacterium]|nr:HAD family phosphatase [candidate division NC10 bacterium]